MLTVALLVLCVHADDPPTVGVPHPRVQDETRFLTNREGAALPLPAEEDAFTFAIFGDRTGGPPEGVEVLDQAVQEVNVIEPDLVMTVGDLVEGYNETAQWLEQKDEFKGIMDQLLMPWFPVAGNHDVYGRRGAHHEADYETHFGPLWYAFVHKDCWFVVLYSDEGNPATGRKSFDDPAAQRMSPEQFAWLQDILAESRDAMHVFVFLHHPRWLGRGYGNDWDRVHAQLASAGNVRAVFAGHIHQMRYDGRRDGIEYVTLATTGGVQTWLSPEAGYLHHYHLVTVRRDQIAMAALPVGEVMDVRAVTGEISEDVARLARQRPRMSGSVPVPSRESHDVEVTLGNPARGSIEVTLIPESTDRHWRFDPDHEHVTIAPGEERTFAFRVRRDQETLDASFAIPTVRIETDLLGPTGRYTVRKIHATIPIQPLLAAPARPNDDHVVRLDGRRDALRLEHDQIDLPDGPLTVECWTRPGLVRGRRGLVTKTENSEFGLFMNDGVPSFLVFIGERYVEVASDALALESGRWYHVAGVWDGREARLYLDGRRVAQEARRGARRKNGLPLYVGADVRGNGEPMSHFSGAIDMVRVSSVARYSGARFAPSRERYEADEDTALLLNMDARVGAWLFDESRQAAHPVVVGAPKIESAATKR